MQTIQLKCGLTVLIAGQGGAVTSSGARFAVAEADGETVIETAPSRADAYARANEIARDRGLPVSYSWRDVPLYWLDSARALTDEQRVEALREYRSTGGMHMVVLAQPSGSDSPEECERLSQAGPAVDEIDWAGFDS